MNRNLEREYELPMGYGDDRIVAQVRDPYWIHAYWEITDQKREEIKMDLGESSVTARPILRVYDISNITFNGNNAHSFFDIEINYQANNWYIKVGKPGRSYCVDLGLLTQDGRFVVLARSNTVSTPLDVPSWITDEEWMTLKEDFDKLYGLIIRSRPGSSSEELTERQMKPRLTD